MLAILSRGFDCLLASLSFLRRVVVLHGLALPSMCCQVRSVLAYFKSEDDAQNSVGVGGTSTKGRLILVPTAKVRRVSTVICIDSDGFKLQLRTETKDEADRWVAALVRTTVY